MIKRRPIKLNDEQRRLVEENTGLVVYALRREYGHDYASDEDNIAEGMYALCRAAARYNAAEGARFTSYAYRAIANWPHVLARNANMKKRKSEKRPISLDAPIRTPGRVLGGKRGQTVGDCIKDNRPGPDEQAENTINAEAFGRLIASIAEDYPLVVQSFTSDTKSACHEIIARRENVSRQAVYSRFKRQHGIVLDKYAKEYRRVMYGDEDDSERGEIIG